MAIAFAQVNIHSRAKGHSAVAASAYRSASIETDERTGVVYDYTKRADVAYTNVLLPESSGSEFKNNEYLWNQIESAEKRRDSQLCKDFVLALPKELGISDHIELAERFAQIHFIDNDIPVEVSIHNKGDGNPHAHLLVPTRRLEKNGFSKYKARDLNPGFAKGFVVEQDLWGKQWGDFQNEYFQEINTDLRVDLNHLIPERHEGVIRSEESYIRKENQKIKQARKQIVLHDVENVLNILSLETSVFTKKDIEKLFFKSVNSSNPVQFMGSVTQILENKNVIELGLNDRGEMAYTTRHQYVQESKLIKDVNKLESRKNHVFNIPLDVLFTKYTLNEEQKVALSYVTKGNDISIVVGKPGTGKSHLLKPINVHFKTHKYRVHGAALSGKVAKALQDETGIKSSTIASLSYRLAKGHLKLGKKDVVIIDEAGMVDFASMRFIINQVTHAGAKLVLVGDPEQLSPIKKGAVFKGILDHVGYISLDAIKRQRDELDRQASIDYSKGRISKALNHYDIKGVISFDEMDNSIAAMVKDWGNDINSLADLKANAMLSFRRMSVNQLNETARSVLIQKGLLGDESFTFERERLREDDDIRVNDKVKVGITDKNLGVLGGEYAHVSSITATHIMLAKESGGEVAYPIHLRQYLDLPEDGQITICKGERLLLTKNNRKLGVRNGDLVTVVTVGHERLRVKLDNGKEVELPKTYKYIDYGYGLTVHKSQGMTVDNARVLIDSKFWHRALGFVALTRHRHKLKVFVDTDSSRDVKQLTEVLSKKAVQDNVIDWPLNLAIRYGFSPDSVIGRAVNKIAGIGSGIKDKFNYVANYEQFLKSQARKEAVVERGKRRELARLAAGYLDAQKANSKLFKRLERTASKTKTKIQEMPDYERLYKLGLERDKKAYVLCRQGGKELPVEAMPELKPEMVLGAANRYAEYKIIKAIAKQQTVNPEKQSTLAEKSYQLKLDINHPQIARQSRENGLDGEQLFERIKQYQTAHKKVLTQALLKDYPKVGEYIKASKERSKFTGYQAELLDKKRVALAKEILSDKKLTNQIGKHFKNLHNSLKKSLALGKDKGVEH